MTLRISTLRTLTLQVLTLSALFVFWPSLTLAEGFDRFQESKNSESQNEGIDFDRIVQDLCQGKNTDLLYVGKNTALLEHFVFGTIVFKVKSQGDANPVDLFIDGIEAYACKLPNLPIITMGEIGFELPIALGWCGWVDEDFIYWIHAA